VVPCTSSVVVDGKRFENYDDYPASALGNIPLRTAVANSCNTAFISQRGKLGQQSLVEAAASLGMGVDHDLGFPAYFGNVVRPPARPRRRPT
jgi:cell division protein FtsI/penicillin-binding protein 2